MKNKIINLILIMVVMLPCVGLLVSCNNFQEGKVYGLDSIYITYESEEDKAEFLAVSTEESLINTCKNDMKYKFLKIIFEKGVATYYYVDESGNKLSQNTSTKYYVKDGDKLLIYVNSDKSDTPTTYNINNDKISFSYKGNQEIGVIINCVLKPE